MTSKPNLLNTSILIGCLETKRGGMRWQINHAISCICKAHLLHVQQSPQAYDRCDNVGAANNVEVLKPFQSCKAPQAQLYPER